MGDIKGTVENRLAGDYIKQARESLDRSQPEFARDLAAAMEISLSQSMLSRYERGDGLVPGALLFAAARLSGLPLLNPASERVLAQRVAAMERDLRDLRRRTARGGSA